MKAFTYLDFIILTVLIIPVIFGLFRGFFRAIFGLIGSLVGLGLAITFSRPFGDGIVALWKLKDPFAGRVIAFFILYLGCWLTGIYFGFMMRKILKKLKLAWLDRLMGGLFGLVKGGVIVAIAMIFMTVIPDLNSELAKSKLAPVLIRETKRVLSIMPASWQSYLDPGRWIGEAKRKITPSPTQDKQSDSLDSRDKEKKGESGKNQDIPK